MKVGPRYKKARKLGAGVFEKTSTAKFALKQEQKNAAGGKRAFKKPLSNFGKQLLEKQKARFTYIVTERQFSNYANSVIEKQSKSPTQDLYSLLEHRLDNVVLRAGFVTTRFHARQIVSHGHILVNGKKVTIPSFNVSSTDTVSIREGSKSKGMFVNLEDKIKAANIPAWLKVDGKKAEIKVVGEPKYAPHENIFDLATVIEYYRK